MGSFLFSLLFLKTFMILRLRAVQIISGKNKERVVLDRYKDRYKPSLS